jgi:hypothetical protein
VAKRRRGTTPASIKRKEKEGRGKGERDNYKSYLTGQDVPSEGNTWRCTGWSTNREYIYFSDLEYYYHLIVEWLLHALDIWEQYCPVELEQSLMIASKAGIKHPIDPNTKHPKPITIDLYLTVWDGHEKKYIALCVKPTLKLASQRMLEKLELERLICEIRNATWRIGTERELTDDIYGYPMGLARNLDRIHEHYFLDHFQISPNVAEAAARFLTPRIARQNTPLNELTNECDKRLGNSPGTSLAVVWHLIARRKWLVDMNVELDPESILTLNDIQF